MNLRNGKRGPWLGCSNFPKCKGRMGWKTLDENVQTELQSALDAHEKLHPQEVIKTLDGTIIPEGTPIETLIIEGAVAKLELFE